ncbi:uncharacterized protein [Heptranchias perlo]|uniref:uncharacterized protein isoform X1 n=1 Tax=Heptranchias perlo TaxID=212740 RepID=UPI00355A2816
MTLKLASVDWDRGMVETQKEIKHMTKVSWKKVAGINIGGAGGWCVGERRDQRDVTVLFLLEMDGRDVCRVSSLRARGLGKAFPPDGLLLLRLLAALQTVTGSTGSTRIYRRHQNLSAAPGSTGGTGIYRWHRDLQAAPGPTSGTKTYRRHRDLQAAPGSAGGTGTYRRHQNLPAAPEPTGGTGIYRQHRNLQAAPESAGGTGTYRRHQNLPAAPEPTGGTGIYRRPRDLQAAPSDAAESNLHVWGSLHGGTW